MAVRGDGRLCMSRVRISRSLSLQRRRLATAQADPATHEDAW